MTTHRLPSVLARNSLETAAQFQDTTADPPATAPSEYRNHHHQRTGTQSTSSSRRMVSSIRHSQAEGFEFDPLMAAVQARKEKERRRQREREIDESTRSSSTTTTAYDNDLLADEPDVSLSKKERIREAGQVATVFLEMRRGIQDSHHVPSLPAQRPELEQLPERHHTKVSRTTLQRAEKTKVMLNLRYFSMFQAQKPIHSPPKYEGVDGVYNPLQVIRNRRVRKKFHQPPHISIKTIPFASEAFSKSKEKLLWQVDLDELANDQTWRTQHWYDLTNPRGELWFQPDNANKGSSQHKHRIHLHHRNHKTDDDTTGKSSEGLVNMHDRLFQSGDEDSSKDSSKDSKDDLLEAPRSRKRDIIVDKIKRKRSKSPYKRNQSITELSKIVTSISETPRRQPSVDYTQSQPHLLMSTTPSPHGLLQEINIEPIHTHERVLSNTSTGDLLSAGSGLAPPVHTRNPSSSVSATGLPNSFENSTPESTDLEFEESKLQNDMLKALRHTHVLTSYGGHNIANTREEYQSSVNYNTLFQDYTSTEEMTEYLKTSVLAPYESSLKVKSEELQNIHNELATEFSTRIDKLLLLSDRTIGEVNTTLSLEARKLTERYEKLGPLHRRKDALVSFSYWLLENLVVLILWLIWIGFSLGRIIKFIFLFVWNFATWFFK